MYAGRPGSGSPQGCWWSRCWALRRWPGGWLLLLGLTLNAALGWWWADPAGRATRPRWVPSATHGFLAFVVVNATVVFGPEERRMWYAAALGVLVVLAVVRKEN